MIIIPLVIGLLVNRYFPKILKIAEKILPGIAMLSICFIIAITIAISRDDLLKIGLTLFAASACHNAIGYFLGYNMARIFGLNRRDCRTIALEVGIQNGGMATGLAFNVLNDAKAALASAVFGPWSAITSSALASWWRRSGNQKEISKE
jgi:BASS family bile acid:Na+ symporter